MKTSVEVFGRGFSILVSLLLFLLSVAAPSHAQSKLSLQEAIDKALESRASLKAEAERVSIAQGNEKQAELIANPVFQFENQNLRPGQTYTRDVDTYAYVTQPLDVLGKRKQRIAVAEDEISRTEAGYQLIKRQIIQSVKLSYWEARGAQEKLDLLRATVENFQKIIDYQSAQLSVGAISEQDLLRVQLEGERLKIAANLAEIEASRARVQLLKAMGRTDFSAVLLTEPLDMNIVAIEAMDIGQVLSQRIEMKVANAAVEEAQAKSRLQDVSARPDLNVIYGYKRTQLVDATSGVNTATAGLQITLPITDRNQGNRAAASAEVRRQQQLLAATEADIRVDYFGAFQEYQLRRREVIETLQPLREHAGTISEIAQAAYAKGGTDLLRLLDAERAQLDAQLAYVQGMTEYQQSISNLQAAEGVAP
ncbi:MAG: outer membrane protein [Candidatus Acidoferrum typicum]|nr:outer membrane protein [Candidatus Acidoferrum typicum]